MKPVKLFPEGAEARNKLPLAAVLDYFPLALIEIAKVIQVGNDQHNPGEPVHWAREKSTDHGNKMLRHYMERGKMDTDNTRHAGKMAWRALALLETELELAQGYDAVAEAKAAKAPTPPCPHPVLKWSDRREAWECRECGVPVDWGTPTEACL
ncbi:MAG: hypothetical protein K0S14_235 [Thermomicrobiales bacterium]|jgi:hypothetical protein|nr:hypothetical protein [Thermomicrobiales bacterium]